MKKILIVALSILLCACSSNKTDEKTEVSTSGKNTSAQNLQYLNLSEGFSTEDGFYHMVMVDNEKGETRYNIRYFDYASKQEVYLCDKPQCSHDNDSCTSYLPLGGLTSLFVSNNHLYLLKNPSMGNVVKADGSIEKEQGNPSILYRMDIDGKNKKILCKLEEGFEFESTVIALSEDTLYVVASKHDLIAMDENSSTEIKTDSFLYKINLENGEKSTSQNMKDKFMVGAKQNTILFQNLHYSQDLDELLKNKDYETYDRVSMQATTMYQTYDSKQNKLGKEFSTNEHYPTFDGDYVFYLTQQNELCKQNIQDGNVEVLTQLNSGYTYVLSTEITDGYLVIEAWNNNAENEYVKSFVYSLEKDAVSEVTQFVKGTNEPLRILGATKDNYFMLYRKDGHMETTWAGTQQFETDKAYYGLISKSDFYNGLDTFEDVSSIDQ
ncbi:MAG: hypothetical protein RR441_07900 [Longicatena sp.]